MHNCAKKGRRKRGEREERHRIFRFEQSLARRVDGEAHRVESRAGTGIGSKRPTHAQTERANDVIIIDTAVHEAAQEGQQECLHDIIATDGTATY